MSRDPMTRRPRPLSGFWRDRRGVSAVEFALIAPIVIAMYCGMAELTQAMLAQRRVSNITSAIGDLVAQNSQVGPKRMADIFRIGDIIMAPFPASKLTMCVNSVISDANGKDTVSWRWPAEANTAGCAAANAVVTDVPVGVLPANQSVILARATYAYASPSKMFLNRDLTFSRTYYLRPRRADLVIWNKDG